MLIRPRRNRKNAAIRSMVQETRLTTDNLIFPLFVVDGENKKESIPSLPNMHRWSKDLLFQEVESCLELGIRIFDLFPAVDEAHKDKFATYSHADENFYLHIIRGLKERFPEATLMSDVAMDPYSSDGHDGIVEHGEIVNDKTLQILAKMALAQAQAGVDIIGPSDMMDGRVQAIREELDENGYTNTRIMSYSAKYASSLYGPFRDALNS
ncbi:unnamed protein product, partial [Chrysoparadoxa australica]